ncbi:MAG: phosphatidate cytidylyltransferase [Streptococcaceae bacterium]|jgi:phosphatidate cytidylyltransferase|nr:phosphatidate cytidylyltransferase [Streptococcaceae bacterium]
MIQRTITAVVAGVAFIAVLVWGGIALNLLTGVLAILVTSEFFRMKGLRLLSFEGVLIAAAGAALAMPGLSSLLHLDSSGPFLLFALFVMVLLAATVFAKGTYSFEDLAFPFFVAFYAGLGFQCLVLARNLSLFIVLLAVAMVWATDIFAYLVGRQFGRRKLIPEVSPSKTIEGSIGGILGAVVVALILLTVFHSQAPQLGYVRMIIYAVLFSAAGQMGDLVESAIKRRYGVKDSGNILPGHGGIFDRFDSMLFVLPLMHLLGLF